jgi:hypothetical protein
VELRAERQRAGCRVPHRELTIDRHELFDRRRQCCSGGRAHGCVSSFLLPSRGRDVRRRRRSRARELVGVGLVREAAGVCRATLPTAGAGTCPTTTTVAQRRGKGPTLRLTTPRMRSGGRLLQAKARGNVAQEIDARRNRARHLAPNCLCRTVWAPSGAAKAATTAPDHGPKSRRGWVDVVGVPGAFLCSDLLSSFGPHVVVACIPSYPKHPCHEVLTLAQPPDWRRPSRTVRHRCCRCRLEC